MSQEIVEQIMNPQTTESGEVLLYQPGEIPPYWQDALNRYGIKILQLAMTFGYVIPEYTMRDYVNYAIESPSGSETIDIWGKQGSMKSNRTLQIAHWVYDDWDTAIEEMVLMPDARGFSGYENRGFLQKMQSIKKGKCVPLVSWDDLTVNMPSSTFKTDIKVYGAIDSAWAAIRTKIKVVVLNNPLIDRIGKNVKDNVTIEVMIGPNQVELIERWFRLIGLKHPDSNFFKAQVEPLHKFDWRNVPTSVFRQYHSLRLEIADFAVHRLGAAFGDEVELRRDLIPVQEIIPNVTCSVNTIQSLLQRGIVRKEKVGDNLYVKKVDYENIILRDYGKAEVKAKFVEKQMQDIQNNQD